MKRTKRKSSNGITLIALVITIIVLLILAGVSIATLTGDNGILSKATTAKEKTKEGEVKEGVDLILQEWNTEKYTGTNMTLEEFLNSKKSSGELDEVIKNDDGTFIVEKDGYEVQVADDGKTIGEIEKTGGIRPKVQIELFQENGEPLDETVSFENAILVVNVANEADIKAANGSIAKTVKDKNNTELQEITAGDKKGYLVKSSETYTIIVISTVEEIEKETTVTKTIKAVPEYWKVTTKDDAEWYGYSDISVETPVEVQVNAPKLKGQMTPIKYVGEGEEQTGSKWANAITADGSMWVWIPRYAYKITEGYHTNVAGTIEIAFIDTNNQFLNNGDSGEITENPAEADAGTEKWLVHPAFTANAANGGGFGNLEGIWVGKFEATGTSTAVSVKPGVNSLCNMTINEQFKAGKNAKYGETVDLGSHMAKNSEWGATVYLAHSKYGSKGQEVERNGRYPIRTGGDSKIETIYTIDKNQSTTQNATGVYDLYGGGEEYVAVYLNNGETYLETYGGINAGDLYGANDAERATSSKYKTVYPSIYGDTQSMKGDAIYETSDSSASTSYRCMVREARRISEEGFIVFSSWRFLRFWSGRYV